MSVQAAAGSRPTPFTSADISMNFVDPLIDHDWMSHEFYEAFKELGMEPEATEEEFIAKARRSFEKTSAEMRGLRLTAKSGPTESKSLARVLGELGIASAKWDGPVLAWVASHKGESIGSITTVVSFCYKTGEWECDVTDLLVKPDFRRRGLGSIMLAHAEGQLRNSVGDWKKKGEEVTDDKLKMTSSVHPKNIGSLRLFQKTGYQCTGPVDQSFVAHVFSTADEKECLGWQKYLESSDTCKT